MKNLVLLAFLFVNVVCSSQKVQSEWPLSPVNIDGQKQDWQQGERLVDSRTGILYGVANDDENLYLYFEFPDTKLQMKAKMAGFSLEFLAKTKPKLKASIDFPTMERPRRQEGQRNMGDSMEEGRRNIGDRKEDNQADYLIQARYSEIEGFFRSSDYISRSRDQHEPFSFDIGRAKQNLLFELQVPFVELFPETISMEEIIASKLKIKATLHGVGQASGAKQGGGSGSMQGGGRGSMGGGRGSMGGGNSGMRGGGMGGQGGGRSGGMGGPGANSEDMLWMSSEQTFTLKVLFNEGENLEK